MEDGENVWMVLTDHKYGITRTQTVRNSTAAVAQDCNGGILGKRAMEG